jgi:hypothetical protein
LILNDCSGSLTCGFSTSPRFTINRSGQNAELLEIRGRRSFDECLRYL